MKNLVNLLILTFLMPTIAFAGQNSSQNQIINGKFTLDFFNNYTYESDNPNNEYNENYARTKLDLKANITKNLSLNTQLRIEEVNRESEEIRRSASLRNRDNSSFENEAGHIEKLNLSYNYKNTELVAGKFTTRFGQSWNREDNIWIFQKARSEYRQNEKIGLASYITGGHKEKSGLYTLGIASFVNDNKYLDGSIITKRENSNKNDGKAGNDKGIGSYIASLDIEYDFGNQEELSYHISYINLAVNERQSPINKEKIEDSEGYAINMNYKYPIYKNIVGEGFVEYVNINNNNANSDADVDYLTATLSLHLYQNFTLTAGKYTEKQKELGTNGADISVNEFNISYKFNESSILKNMHLIAGIKREKNDFKTSNIRDNVAGLRLRYIKEF